MIRVIIAAIAVSVLGGCAMFKGEEIQCTGKLITGPITVSGCASESWDGHSPVSLKPCGFSIGAGPGDAPPDAGSGGPVDAGQ